MNDKDDCAWVFDSLIGFLQGPIWSSPLLTFIEEKSLVFEANTEDCEEYRKIYQEYKNLVDLLLGCFMEDMGIAPEQFEQACSVNRDTKIPIQFQHNLFEQIWAANEYEIFKRMMIQKNLELQLQALNMIEQKFGLTPASLMYEDFIDDELVMEDLLHKHALENPNEQESDIPPESTFIVEHERLAAEYHNERALLEEALKKSQETCRNASDDESTTGEVEYAGVPVEKGSSEKFPRLKMTEPLKPIPVCTKQLPDCTKKSTEDEINAEDMKKRQDYLKSRRDKLVALKKEARSEQLNKTRPSSARVIAEATMKGKQELEAAQAADPSLLQVRRALAARLKAEVVHNCKTRNRV